MRDEDVPFSHALALMQRFGGDPATLTLIKDGDHRLSRPQDLQLMFDALERMVTLKGITPTSRRSDAGWRREP
jgi:dipeptidyl aminopeptidase/acylaminoacyl peptidase